MRDEPYRLRHKDAPLRTRTWYEVQLGVHVGVDVLLERQLYVEPDRRRPGLPRAPVSSLHYPWTSARDDGEPRLAERPSHRDGRPAHRVFGPYARIRRWSPRDRGRPAPRSPPRTRP